MGFALFIIVCIGREAERGFPFYIWAMPAVRISTRLVFLAFGYALKIPIDSRGWIQGKNERKTWDEYHSTELLVDLVWSFGAIICQRRAEAVEEIPVEYIREVKKAIPHFRILNCDLHNPKNWGRHGGKIVLLDYGIDEKVSRMY